MCKKAKLLEEAKSIWKPICDAIQLLKVCLTCDLEKWRDLLDMEQFGPQPAIKVHRQPKQVL